MNKSTRTEGKERGAAESVKIFQNFFEKKNLRTEIASQANPVKDIWWINLRLADYPEINSNGKGFSRDEAMASAFGELAERVLNGFIFSDFYLGKRDQYPFIYHTDEFWIKKEEYRSSILNKTLWEFYDPDNELRFHDFTDFSTDSKDEIAALPMREEFTKDQVLFPVNLLDNVYVSNGMSAGNTVYEARVQAISEITERYVKKRVIFEELSLPDFPEEFINTCPEICRSVEELKKENFKILIKDASLGGVFPVVNITLINPEDSGVFLSFGSHPDIRIALKRAMSEILQGRTKDNFRDLPVPESDNYLIKDEHNFIQHFIHSQGRVSWKFFRNTPDFEYKLNSLHTDSRKEEYEYMAAVYKALDKKIYCVDWEYNKFACTRIVIPSVSEIYSEQELLNDNKNKIKYLRNILLNTDFTEKQSIKSNYETLADSEEMNSSYALGRILGYSNKTSIPPSEEFLLALALLNSCNEDALMIWDEYKDIIKRKNNKTFCFYSTLFFIHERGTEKLSEYSEIFGKTGFNNFIDDALNALEKRILPDYVIKKLSLPKTTVYSKLLKNLRK